MQLVEEWRIEKGVYEDFHSQQFYTSNCIFYKACKKEIRFLLSE